MLHTIKQYKQTHQDKCMLLHIVAKFANTNMCTGIIAKIIIIINDSNNINNNKNIISIFSLRDNKKQAYLSMVYNLLLILIMFSSLCTLDVQSEWLSRLH